MPHSRSLLSRLESPPPASNRHLPGDLEEAMESIHQHLQLMLNSRHGNAQTAPEFGTSDFSDFFKGYESIDTLKQQIERSISLYEPRLTGVDVVFAPNEDDPHRIHFEITGSLVTEDQQVPAVFRTVLEGTGELKVTRG